MASFAGGWLVIVSIMALVAIGIGIIIAIGAVIEDKRRSRLLDEILEDLEKLTNKKEKEIKTDGNEGKH